MPELDRALARRIRLVGFDVDGVLTDGGVYLGMGADQPIELKRFFVPDGLALKLLQAAGIVVAVVSGRESDATTLRARELGVDELVQDDAARKLPAWAEILSRRGVAWEESAFVGDDLPDLPLLTRVGLPIAVANAAPEVRAVARVVTRAAGGAGAAREAVETILRARGEWETLVRSYLKDRGDVEERTAGSR